MSFREAFGEGAFHLAAGNRRHCLSVSRPAIDAARRHRLAQARENLDAGVGRMSDDDDSPVFIGFLLLHSDESGGILEPCFPLRCRI